MTTTIRDLAEKLNLSITTVSRALDGYRDIAEETRKRVIETAREIGYEPSFAARQLRRKRSDAIGYILPTSAPQFTDPFYTSFLTGLCDEVAAQHLDLLVTSAPPESEQEKSEYHRWVQSRRVDGMVINRTRVYDWRIQYLAESHIPFVSLGYSQTGASYPCIIVNERKGIHSLVTHLIQKGHRRIAFIGASSELVIQVERLGGYRQGLEDSGIPFDPALVLEGDLTEPGGYRTALQLLNQKNTPTAILGCNDQTALGVLRAANEKGIAIGTQLAIAGYDGLKETQYTHPPLTTLQQPTYEIARQLAKMLVKRIEGETLEVSKIVIQPQLLVRASTG